MSTYYSRNKEKIKERRKLWLKNNPEKRAELNAKSKEWREKNREAFREMQRDWMKENPTYYFVNNARRRAKDLGVPFELTYTFMKTLEIPAKCPYLGIDMIIGGGSGDDNSPSLDRIIPEKGYVPGNVEFISMKANRMKQEHTVETLELFLNRLKEITQHA